MSRARAAVDEAGSIVRRWWAMPSAAAVIWTVYLLLPVRSWGVLHGRPLGPIGTITLFAVWWGWAFYRRLPGKRLVLALIALKLLIGSWLLLEPGFLAHYYANDSWRTPHERSIDFLLLPATRVDERLEFRQHVDPFPLFFFNDSSRFNFYLPGQPDRLQLPFSVVWTGHLFTPNDVSERFFLEARVADPPRTERIRASLTIDGRTLIELGGNLSRSEGEARLDRGAHRIEVRYANPPGAPRRFAAGVVRVGRDHFLGAGDVYVEPRSRWRILADRVVRAGSWSLDLALMVILGGWSAWRLGGSVSSLARWAGRRGPGPLPTPDALALAVVALIAGVALHARPLAGVTIFLSGGHDWLTHETLARDIALHGPLMTLGRPIGQGSPFSTQPFYPYFLAAVHLIVGEDFWGAWVLQRLLLAAMVWAAYRLTAGLFGRVAGWLALALAAYFVSVMSLVEPPFELSHSLLGEALFLPLLAFWILALERLSGSGAVPVSRAAWTGVLGGVAVLTRSPLLLALPPLGFVLAKTWCARWRRASVLPFVIFACCLGGTIGVATVRNVVVSGQWVPVSNAGPINLFVGNMPPAGIDLSRADDRSIYRRLGLDPLVAKIAEYAVQAPGSFGRGLVRKARYVLGLLGPRGAERRFFAFICASALAGLTLVIAGPSAGHPSRFLPAIVAIAHFAVVVVIGNFTYGYRLAYPMYLMLLPYSAVALERGGRAIGRRILART